MHDLDGQVPGGFDAAYAFDVIEHVDDPLAFLAEMERRAALVEVNLLEPDPFDQELHRELPVRRPRRARAARGHLCRYRRLHGRSHLVVYRRRAAATLARAARCAAGGAGQAERGRATMTACGSPFAATVRW